MLCSSCERLLSEFERYAIGVIYTPELFNVKREINKNLNERWFGVDYKKFRLFQLSILFRSAVAVGEPWANVILPDNEIEELRKSIIENKPIQPNRFGCLVKVLLNPANGKKLHQTIGSPSSDTVTYRRHYVFCFGGYIWEFIVPSLTYKQRKEGNFLNEKGFLKCPSISLWEHPIIGTTFSMAYDNEIDRLKREGKGIT